ncbi:MAG TPA: cyclase family protein [Alcaligenaceae bacterium]|nr:cyclase family protein [Alcaligenaceae bacterium]
MSNALDLMIQALNDKSVKVIDLTHPLNEEFPSLQLPDQFGQTAGFSKQRISKYDDKGPGWYWNNFTCGEHTGTHFDAPAHWVSGSEHTNATVDTVPVENFIRPAVVIDASAEVAKDDNWILTPEYLEAWEEKHGRIPAKSWVFFRTDWSKRLEEKGPEAYVNMHEDGPHTPGPSKEAVEWMIERDVIGFGVETINTDAGKSMSWDLPLPCHTLMHGANRYGLQCMRNLDQLPPTGALIISAPLKIEDGSGSPLRVLAIVNS